MTKTNHPIITEIDRKIMFTALGFIAVVMSDSAKEDRGATSRTMAALIEKHCRQTVPEAFAENEACEDSGYTRLGIDGLIDGYKYKIKTQNDMEAAMPKRRSILLLMHQVLEERACSLARQNMPAALLAKLNAKMISDEIKRERSAL